MEVRAQTGSAKLRKSIIVNSNRARVGTREHKIQNTTDNKKQQQRNSIVQIGQNKKGEHNVITIQ